MKIAMKLFLYSIVILSCTKNASPDLPRLFCEKTDPINQLSWLKNLIDGKTNCMIYSGATVYGYTYNKTQIFYFQNPASSQGTCTQAIYDCSGSLVDSSDQNLMNFVQNRLNGELLWKK